MPRDLTLLELNQPWSLPTIKSCDWRQHSSQLNDFVLSFLVRKEFIVWPTLSSSSIILFYTVHSAQSILNIIVVLAPRGSCVSS